MRLRTAFVLSALLVAAILLAPRIVLPGADPPAGPAGPSAPAAPEWRDDTFPVPAGLEPSVEFWRNVYAAWSEHEVVFHDRDDLSVVYDKIHQRRSDTPEGYRANEAAQEAIIRRYRAILLDLAERNPDPATLSGDYEDVAEAWGRKGNP